MIDTEFWSGKKVFITGSTGFKGSWLSIWLNMMHAQVLGYALEPNTNPSLFSIAGVENIISQKMADIRDAEMLFDTISDFKPDIVFHLAAQPIVRVSYDDPVETYDINVMGTVKLFDVIRKVGNIRTVVNVTTDKCYQNNEWVWGYRENEPLGGYDPYSNSKACSELVTSSYRDSFFNNDLFGKSHNTAVASARAGNVIGGGDWAKDRLIPDILRSFGNNETVIIRNPHAIRPWQHVLEPLSGYLSLAQKLFKDGAEYAESWNLGPEDRDAKSVGWIVERMCEKWGGSAQFEIVADIGKHEASYLKLDISKAKQRLHWQPRWTLDESLEKIVSWEKARLAGKNVYSQCEMQIQAFMES